ncbi:mediator complex, subunit Med10 [Obelidium mucronatum]|nr:mediator complex, subunit Med10 [Obelidium mucronatum]
MDSSDAKALAVLEKSIQGTIDALFKISATTFDFQPDSGPVLHQRITRLTTKLQEVETVAQNVNVNVPFSAIECIESGGNPDTYTKDMTQVLVDKNQKTNGIISAVKHLHNQLSDEVRRNYPELYAEYEKTVLQNE